MNKSFILECDPSDTSVAALLKQENDNGRSEIIMPVTRKLKKTERNRELQRKNHMQEFVESENSDNS